ncbi:hypothetical protein CJ030_MR5G025807 [Morella rubra]|uniref:Uncharacterized protein n=1 Tax=Morella rubra TaxID=262757 RepID=A0A6A1VM83_9ROSI|nr:hypothetical protein CJ030_MR5G025807 [Morella rubra]
MDWEGIQEDGLRTRSFRNEDYNNRRVFLRSYPLQWGGDDEHIEEDIERITDGSSQKKFMKKIILSVFFWGGERVLLLRRLKHKLTTCVISCIPAGFKTLQP